MYDLATPVSHRAAAEEVVTSGVHVMRTKKDCCALSHPRHFYLCVSLVGTGISESFGLLPSLLLLCGRIVFSLLVVRRVEGSSSRNDSSGKLNIRSTEVPGTLFIAVLGAIHTKVGECTRYVMRNAFLHVW